MGKNVPNRVENKVGKGENAGYHFPHYLQNGSYQGSLKPGVVR